MADDRVVESNGKLNDAFESIPLTVFPPPPAGYIAILGEPSSIWLDDIVIFLVKIKNAVGILYDIIEALDDCWLRLFQ